MYNKITLKNGVRIVCEKLPFVRSASLGIWVKNGTRYENEEVCGISHFIEHMLFKGTDTRTFADIASEMDRLGGTANAFTTKECTSYYIKTLDIYLKDAINLLADMFLNSKFGESEVNLERTVIFEEIDMYDDNPEDFVTEKLFEACFSGSQLAMPILGTKDSLKNITPAALKAYMKSNYRPKDTVISISGSYSDEDIMLISSLFENMTGEGSNKITTSSYKSHIITKEQDIEQNHICIAFSSIGSLSYDRYALQLLSNILGGGMSSRLFQSVREEKGLCYSIYSFNTPQIETGLFNIYTALNGSCEEEAILKIKEVCLDVRENGVLESELKRSVDQARINILMALESTSSRMGTTAKGEIYHGKAISTDETIANYEKVTLDDIKRVAKQIINFETASIAVVGSPKDKEYYKNLLIK